MKEGTKLRSVIDKLKTQTFQDRGPTIIDMEQKKKCLGIQRGKQQVVRTPQSKDIHI